MSGRTNALPIATKNFRQLHWVRRRDDRTFPFLQSFWRDIDVQKAGLEIEDNWISIFNQGNRATGLNRLWTDMTTDCTP